MSTIAYAKALGLVGSGLLTGGSLCISAFAVPSLLPSTSPSEVVQRQWAALYNSGKRWFPPAAILTSAAFAEVAWVTRDKEWVVAATATVAIVPYTFAFMMGNIRELTVCVDKDKLPGLVKRWAWLNLGRSVLLGIAFGTAVWKVCT